MNSIKTFKVSSVNLQRLTISEKKILPLLIEAAKKVDEIYKLQENHINNGANFYPRDAIKSEIIEASQKNSKILSPFTIVKRQNNKLIAIDYHLEYKKLLKPISALLTKASKISDNKSFKNYLEITARCLLNGNYTKIDKAWVEVKDSNLDIVIGPFERYIDKLFFVKRTYQADVSVIDKERSKKAAIFRDILYSTVGQNEHRVPKENLSQIQVKESFVFSGFLGRALFTQQHLPSDTSSVEKYGSKVLGYASSLDYKFEKLIYPIFLTVFEENFRKRYSRQLIKTGCYYRVLLNGIVQHLHRYKGSRTRLKELFPILDEANTATSGIQHAKHLVLKGVINQKELEAIMIAQICWFFSEWVISKSNSTRDVYLQGDALTYNFLKEQGALQEKDGISWPNFAKMFFEMENLATIFTRFLEEGSYEDANDFLLKYSSIEYLRVFDRKLERIKPI